VRSSLDDTVRVCLIRVSGSTRLTGCRLAVFGCLHHPLEPGSPDAISLLLPASSETPETAVSAEPGSAHAAVSLTNNVLVYN
jgi:hypothetical protein